MLMLSGPLSIIASIIIVAATISFALFIAHRSDSLDATADEHAEFLGVGGGQGINFNHGEAS